MDWVTGTLLPALSQAGPACQVPSSLAGEERLSPGATWCQAELYSRDAVEIPSCHWLVLRGSKFLSILLVSLLIGRCSPTSPGARSKMPSGSQHLFTCSTNIIVCIVAVTTATSFIWLLMCLKRYAMRSIGCSFIRWLSRALWIQMITTQE